MPAPKLSYAVLPLALAAFTIGCAEPLPTAPQGTSIATPKRAAASHAEAMAPAQSSEIPVHFIRDNECSGEDVEISGMIHVLARSQPDGTVAGHINYRNVKGIGLTSGTVYRALSVDRFQLRGDEVHSARSFRLISRGSGANFTVRVMYHVVVNGNGEVIVSMNRLTTRCSRPVPRAER